MKKIALIILGILLLTGCSDDVSSTKNTSTNNGNCSLDDLNNCDFTNSIGKHTGKIGNIEYLYYIPTTYNEDTSLLVFLHGCYDSGKACYTLYHMDAYAEQYNFIIVLPSQSTSCNTDKCWNWFLKENRNGEWMDSKAINLIAETLVDNCNIDNEKVYIGGFSAGAAEAVALFISNPLYKSVASIAGLASGIANNTVEAFAAMANSEYLSYNEDFYLSVAKDKKRVLIFQGENDTMVNPNNASLLVKQMTTIFDYIDDDTINNSLTSKLYTGKSKLNNNISNANITSYNDGQVIFYDIPEYSHSITQNVLDVIYEGLFLENNAWQNELEEVIE